MSYEDDRQQSIAISVGINNAAVLAAATDDPFQAFALNVETVIETTLQMHEKYALQAAQEAFPGSTVQQAPVQQFGPATASAAAPPAYTPPAPAPVVAPAAIPGAADGDPETVANWQDFLMAYQNGKVAPAFGAAAVGQWFDNRANKPAGFPDFKKKGNKGEQTSGVWLQSKKNPSWLPTALQQVGLV